MDKHNANIAILRLLEKYTDDEHKVSQPGYDAAKEIHRKKIGDFNCKIGTMIEDHMLTPLSFMTSMMSLMI